MERDHVYNNYYHRSQILIEIVDKAWEMDKLPQEDLNDVIPLSEEVLNTEIGSFAEGIDFGLTKLDTIETNDTINFDDLNMENFRKEIKHKEK
ncbi:anaphase-promoting complex subunit 13 [Anaeramoeba flamelloides]|uniref:Anaphase-promoting complex subunit n=1 Tax=Anaeramoeba flamelloides TaxID=1746091 RepID=A0AAV7ZK09_9EUKA|nr:anaphase-promoting complex subunit [Anaeramoeba flamelloides]KAJ6235783.1 anaphase-promoting complex subunit 13 [Anaeramoeba flamelloides]